MEGKEVGEGYTCGINEGDDIHNQTQCENAHVSCASDIHIVGRHG